MKKYILIMAGGEGTRFDAESPKQFALLKNKPVIMHTFDAFRQVENSVFILVLHERWQEQWKDLCKQYSFKIPHKLVTGGETRFHSVAAGLQSVSNPSIVAIHDAARPLVLPSLIETCFKVAEAKSCAVPVVSINDSIRFVSGPHNKAVDRDQYQVVQTPQVFKSHLILQAYRQSYDEKFTDDATVLGSIGYPVILVAGEAENIKITHPVDLQIAELFLKNRKK